MHPKNPYHTRPDFVGLAGKHPSLAPFVQSGNIDFSDAGALRALTTALLKEDFGINVELRQDRLCPTVANRLDYVLLCLDLADPGPLRAIDIGTGHVAIYALLLHHLRPDAHILATELDPCSLAHARATVAANSNSNSIRVIPAPEGRIFPISASDKDSTNKTYAFTMCNPPFFSSAQHVVASRNLKGPAPAAPTAAINEEVTKGGEEAFIGTMIAESTKLGQVRWFTSLVGRYESLHSLVKLVREVTDNYYVVSLRQARTARWMLIWGFGKERLPDSITRPAVLDPTTSFARLLPSPNTFSIKPDPPRTRGEIASVVLKALKECGLWAVASEASGETSTKVDNALESEVHPKTDPDPEAEEYIPLVPTSNTWSRAARRALQRGDGPPPAAEPLFRARLRITGTEAAEVSLLWDWGGDREAVDGFWKFVLSKSGLLKRPLEGEGEGREERGGFGSGRRGGGGGGGGGGRGGGRDRKADSFGLARGRANQAGHWRGGGRDEGWAGRGRGRGRGRET